MVLQAPQRREQTLECISHRSSTAARKLPAPAAYTLAIPGVRPWGSPSGASRIVDSAHPGASPFGRSTDGPFCSGRMVPEKRRAWAERCGPTLPARSKLAADATQALAPGGLPWCSSPAAGDLVLTKRDSMYSIELFFWVSRGRSDSLTQTSVTVARALHCTMTHRGTIRLSHG